MKTFNETCNDVLNGVYINEKSEKDAIKIIEKWKKEYKNVLKWSIEVDKKSGYSECEVQCEWFIGAANSIGTHLGLAAEETAKPRKSKKSVKEGIDSSIESLREWITGAFKDQNDLEKILKGNKKATVDVDDIYMAIEELEMELNNGEDEINGGGDDDDDDY
jgi:hypothetical protein